MKRLLAVVLLLSACTKPNKPTTDSTNSGNSLNGVSAAKGCVTCTTNWHIIERGTGKDYLIGHGDSTICYKSDSFLSYYLNEFTYKGPPVNVGTPADNTEIITTTCVNK